MLSVLLALCVATGMAFIDISQTARLVYDNCVVLDAQSGSQFFWTIAGDSIQARASTQIVGWVGIGFQESSVTGMGPGDFVTGWIRSDLPESLIIQDRHLDSGSSMPIMDTIQSLTELQGQSSGSGFEISFTRKLNTGDPEDFDLEAHGKDFTLLWAHGTLPSTIDPAYHGPHRGSIPQVNLYAESTCEDPVCPNACSYHGECNVDTKVCKCDETWHGDDCSLRDLSVLTLEDGFQIDYLATTVPHARQMVVSGANESILYVAGSTVLSAVITSDYTKRADVVHELLTGLDISIGVAWRLGTLYVSELTRVTMYPNADDYALQGKSLMHTGTVIIDKIANANGGWHGGKYLGFGPDGRLYIAVGAPCNFCLDAASVGDPQPTELVFPLSTISSANPDGSDFKAYVHGVRNSVGFDWHPDTKEMWFTDNGRDHWGDATGFNRPSDELNHVTRPGQHFGFPFCYGNGTNLTTGGPDPQFNPDTCDSSSPYTGATVEMGPHVAVLGMRFYSPEKHMFPSEYHNAIFVAEHGSWNRPPGEYTGYQVVVVKEGAMKPEVVVTGWLNADNSTKWGRPSDVLPLADGSLLVSDDMLGAVYRISYTQVDDTDNGIVM